IQSVSLITKDSSYAKMQFQKEIHDFGASKKGDVLMWEFKFTNTGDEVLEVDSITGDDDHLIYELSQSVFNPGESGSILVSWDTSGDTGITYKRLVVNANIKGEKREITLTSEVH